MNQQPVLSVKGLTKVFGNQSENETLLPGFRDFSVDLFPGETIGLVGESGCGKTTLARSLTRLIEADSGTILVNGKDFSAMSGNELRLFRQNVQIVFQRPETSLNPRMTVAKFVSEAFRYFHTSESGKEKTRLIELAELVGLTEDHLDRYPHQLSGGEKQRVGIMRAIACNPSVIVLDEPTSALDVSVQAQVLQTLKNIQTAIRTSFLLISHDIAIVRYMSSRVLVMYLGIIIEEGSRESIFNDPRHPYTQALFDAVPRLHAEHAPKVVLQGDATSRNVIKGSCPLLPRCPFAMENCKTMPPYMIAEDGHKVACWLEEKTPTN